VVNNETTVGPEKLKIVYMFYLHHLHKA